MFLHADDFKLNKKRGLYLSVFAIPAVLVPFHLVNQIRLLTVIREHKGYIETSSLSFG